MKRFNPVLKHYELLMHRGGEKNSEFHYENNDPGFTATRKFNCGHSESIKCSFNMEIIHETDIMKSITDLLYCGGSKHVADCKEMNFVKNKCTHRCDHIQCKSKRKKLLSYLRTLKETLDKIDRMSELMDQEYKCIYYIMKNKVENRLREITAESVMFQWEENIE